MNCIKSALQGRLVFRSSSTDPFFNLAFENWLIQDHLKDASLEALFLYRNRPSVIVGRNQNVWAECNVQMTVSAGIPIVRRYSGGGAVYHDLGNANYSVHRRRADFDRDSAAKMIVACLQRDELFLSPRHDIFMRLSNGQTAKVSGSAYKLTRDRAYHHGTMLLDTNLVALKRYLTSPVDIVHRPGDRHHGGVSSVVSPVANMSGLDFDVFCQLVTEAFLRGCQHAEPLARDTVMVSEAQHANSQVDAYMTELRSWSWIYGKSPAFVAKVDNVELEVEDGIVRVARDAQSGRDVAQDTLRHLVGRGFDPQLVRQQHCQTIEMR